MTLVDGLKKRGLREDYKVHKHLQQLWQDFEGDTEAKQRVINESLPRIVFESGGEDNILLLIDIWTYSNPVSLS